jgi:hypothetical protein
MILKNKKKLNEDLINTFQDENEALIAYKIMMKEVIMNAIVDFHKEFEGYSTSEISLRDLNEWLSFYIETSFKLKD